MKRKTNKTKTKKMKIKKKTKQRKKKLKSHNKARNTSDNDFELMIKSISFNNIEISKRVLDAFRICDRKFFVKNNPYLDEPQHIKHGQTISQPTTVARMIRLLNLDRGKDVLEIGTNTGYHAALISYLCWPGKTITIEIFPDLAKKARANVIKLKNYLKKKNSKESRKFSNIKIIAGDALDRRTEIWKYKFDRIYFTAGVMEYQIPHVKEMALELLKENGTILYPTRESWNWGALEIWKLQKRQLKKVYREVGYAFVPLLRREQIKELEKKKPKI